ncbi:polysaccharide biosynthesis/export family protein [Salinimicrobium sediminilitoris]|uniref:polysaccharide biosynthesis/export family protein n=1 Tax=Salinimicrobium sediminilitoris TaxID=2876715 RepID=UPI001E4D7E7D|nr:polysaccharide biosynthesis/export family protein [Salinimicrobium sediminilitoris]MCC8358442.1 polysaccharide biosynthesis/export family protein [Salinimicrobium sediminilitoris]
MNFKFLKVLSVLILGVSLTASCVSRKRIAYFQGLETVQKQQIDAAEKNIQVQPGDMLSIIVSAPELQAAQPFNNFRPTPGLGQGSGGGGNQEPLTYLVNDNGTINFPTLGKMKVTGMTGKELEEKLEEQLTSYLQDPVVTVRVENFQISILGEVGNPGTFTIENDDISLPQALGLAGDITLSGKRKEVLVTRDVNGERKYAYLDLTDANVMNSPFYYLQQNDVVYVEPVGSKIQSTSYLNTAASYLSVVSVITSLILIFTR